jgi:hypothetical protein
MIEDQDKKLTENIRILEIKVAELQAANDLRSAEDRHISVKVAEHQIAIAELRHRVDAERVKFGNGPIDLPNPLAAA